MNSLWDIRIFLGLVPKESHCITYSSKLIEDQQRSFRMQLRALQVFLSPHGATAPSGPGPPHYRGFTNTPRHTTLGRTALGTQSARCRDLCLTTHSTHTRQTSMPPAGFEPTFPASDRLHTGRSVWRPSISVLLHYLQVYLLKTKRKKPVPYRPKNKYTLG